VKRERRVWGYVGVEIEERAGVTYP